jgi:hypothetical protein
MLSRPLLLAYADGGVANVQQLSFYLSSFQRWAPQDALTVLFTTKAMIDQQGNLSYPYRDRVELNDAHILDCAVAKRAVIRRFVVFRDWLQNHKEHFGPVLIADIRDLWFQADPFASVIGNQTVHVYQEGLGLLENEPKQRPYNTRWLMSCRGIGASGYKKLLAARASVVCGGTMAATSVSAMLLLLDRMLPFLQNGCNDQAALIYASQFLLPAAGVPVHNVPMRHASVAHCFTEVNPNHPCVMKHGLRPLDLRLDSLGRILNDLGEPYAVIHQADRFPDLWMRRNWPLLSLTSDADMKLDNYTPSCAASRSHVVECCT